MFLTPQSIEAFLDDKLSSMLRTPLMFGDPFSLETQCHLIIEMYCEFCLDKNVETQGAHEPYQKFRRKQYPKCPGPSLLYHYLTDKQWGLGQSDMDAGKHIIEFYIAWKEDLKHGIRNAV